MNSESLPQPDDAALSLSHELQGRILAAIDRSDGWLGFERFMQMALYEPGLGYYSAGSIKLGPGGDFTTAPEQGDWLARSLAAFLARQFDASGTCRILELGAGSGALAWSLLHALREQGVTAVEYAILETSADLRARQQARLNAVPGHVTWLDTLPDESFSGVILANEVADALPVARFVKSQGQVLPLGVVRDGAGLAIAAGPPDPILSEAVEALEHTLGVTLPDAYCSEVCLMLAPWLDALFDLLDRGGVVLIDYGMPRRDYYREDRTDGTLICHYRQRAHTDPLLWPGLQDLSAWVDFSAVADIAHAAGYDVSGFTTQAQFLLEMLAADPVLASREPTPQQAGELKTLLLPGEMGERFKLIWLTRNLDDARLPGRDFRTWL